MNEFKLPHKHNEKNTYNLQKKLLQTNSFIAGAEIFKQMGDPTRMKIFWLLCHTEECVINIAAFLNMSSPAVSHHLRSLYDCGLISSRREGKEVYYKVADKEECILLHKAVEKIMFISCPKKISDSASTEDIVHSVHDYLVEHLHERITIEKLSKMYHINPTTLKNAFKSTYGSSIAAHIKEHRLEYAETLLKTTDMPIGQIALKAGYESQSRFTEAFKKAYSVLPGEYRNN